MILQILLTIVFGFGVLTLATAALLNTAGHRLHDGERKGLANNAVQFEYKYPTDDAERLRWWFAIVPIWLGIAASMAVISVGHCMPSSVLNLKCSQRKELLTRPTWPRSASLPGLGWVCTCLRW